MRNTLEGQYVRAYDPRGERMLLYMNAPKKSIRNWTFFLSAHMFPCKHSPNSLPSMGTRARAIIRGRQSGMIWMGRLERKHIFPG